MEALMHGLVFAALLAAVPAAPAAPGVRVRFTGVEVPGAKRPGVSAIAGVVTCADDRYTVRDAKGGGVLTLPQPGSRLRGRLVSFESGIMNVVLDGTEDVARVPLAAVSRLQVARAGRDRGRGAQAGAAVGALFGVCLGVAWGQSGLCRAFGCDVTRDTVQMAAGGALIGAGIGAAIGTKRWEPLEPGQVRLSVAPRPGGTGIALTIGLPRR
jgi:hypothetical protein